MCPALLVQEYEFVEAGELLAAAEAVERPGGLVEPSKDDHLPRNWRRPVSPGPIRYARCGDEARLEPRRPALMASTAVNRSRPNGNSADTEAE
jgi:hypothetical protein